jgi:hypothetical protein
LLVVLRARPRHPSDPRIDGTTAYPKTPPNRFSRSR